MRVDQGKAHPWRVFRHAPGKKPSTNFSALLLKQIDKHLTGKDCRMKFGRGLYRMKRSDLGDLLRSAATCNWNAGQKLADVIVKSNSRRVDGLFVASYEQVRELRRWDAK